MKFIKYLYLIVLMMPIITYADDNYEATVVARNAPCYIKTIDYSGDTNYYRSGGILNYNDHIRIKKKEELKDTRLVMDHNGCYIKYTQFIGGNFDPKSFKITNYANPKDIVLLINNCNFYGGPNTNYLDFENNYNEKIIFQYQYSIANKWFFIYYKPEYMCNKTENYTSCTAKGSNAMGWGYINNKNFGIDGNEIIHFPNDVNILDNNGNVLGKLPAKTEINKYYYTYDNNKKIIYIYYNNIEGYIYDIPLFKGNAQIKLNDKEININYYNFNYKDKAFIYLDDKIITLNYDELTIINEKTEIKTNGYIKEIFTDYKTMKAPKLEYQLEESNKEDKEILPENYIIDTHTDSIDEPVTIEPTEEPPQENNQDNKKDYKFILYILAIIVIISMIFIFKSYKNNQKERIFSN